ncbi:hypothetical protein [Falsirhodobacter deserti]|uniref:hypothetical protein n=1 Tax=Falsirhodobacter deserti TaxID=1365611 RepID=UPI000FE3B88E|nr:hypothetical protein [Falsirhodobacter deserti]
MIVDLPDLPANRNRNLDRMPLTNGSSVSGQSAPLPDLFDSPQAQVRPLSPAIEGDHPLNDKVAAVASRLSIWGAFLT